MWPKIEIRFKTSCFTNTVNPLFTPWAGLLISDKFEGRGGGGGGALNRDGHLLNLLDDGGSFLHKDLECEVEKLKYKKLEVMQRRI